jgi:3-hydroxy-9,10-secoandrosta-1,3,5(10)-triene-9,17-dione monooxygenase
MKDRRMSDHVIFEKQVARNGNGPPVIDIHFPTHDDWLSAEELAGLTPAILRERMLALKPGIAARARETELARRPLTDTWSALRKSGIFYHFVPKRYGGLEFGLEDLIDVTLPVCEACASTGWVAGFSMEHNFFLTQFPVETQDEIFRTHPYIIAPAVNAPPGKAVRVSGGYTVTGRWNWASGIMNADWIMAAAVVEKVPANSEPPEVILAIFPAEDATVHDVWHMSGMCGTGSNDFSVIDLFIPEHRTVPVMEFFSGNGRGVQSHDNPMYRVPMLLFSAMCTLIPALGAARSAVSFYGNSLKTRNVQASTIKLMDQPASQVRLSEAELLVRDSELLLRDVCRSMMEQVQRGDTSDPMWRRRIRAQCARSLSLCGDAINVIMRGSGASARALSNPLQRYQRDINTVLGHQIYDHDLSNEAHGRGLLGLPPNNPVF